MNNATYNVYETAEALSDYAKALRLIEWLRENDAIKSEQSDADLAYVYAVEYGTSEVVKANLSFLKAGKAVAK